jgi:hypothetical protein
MPEIFFIGENYGRNGFVESTPGQLAILIGGKERGTQGTDKTIFQSCDRTRVARFFLLYDTKPPKNVPNEHYYIGM